MAKRTITALICAISLLLTLLLPSIGMAQEGADKSIEELMQVDVGTVYGASKYLQTVAEAPAAVTIITADEIKRYGYRKLADILESVPGFWMSYDRNYDYVGVRGFSRPGDYNTRVLLLIDGVRINDNVFDEAPLGNDLPLDIDLIERVEVIRGPSHSLYGSNAFLGVINVVTKSFSALHGAQVSGEAGSFSTYKGRVSYGGRSAGGFETLLSGTFFDSKGQDLYYREFDTPAQNNGWARGRDGERYGSAFLKLRYRDFSLEGGYVRRRKEIPTASFGAVFDTDLNKTTDSRAFADLKFEHEFANRLGVLGRVSFNRYNYDGNYLYDLPRGRLLNIDYSRGNTFATELQLTKEFQRHKVIAGAEIRGNYPQEQGSYDSSASYLNDRRSSVSYGIYAQDEFSLLDVLVLYAGVRYDHFDSFGGTVNPRLALVYSPLEQTTAKLIYARAFRAPNDYELYYASVPNYASNPHLVEETVNSYQLVLEQGIGAHLNGSVSAFYNEMNDIISQTELADGTHIFKNIDAYSTKGIELELRGKWGNGVEGRTSYTLQQARHSGPGNGVIDSPPQLAKFNLTLPLLQRAAFLGIEEQFTAPRKTLAGSHTDSFFVTNLTLLSHKVLKGLELSFSVYNLLNQQHDDPGSQDHVQNTIAQDGRTFRLKATYDF